MLSKTARYLLIRKIHHCIPLARIYFGIVLFLCCFAKLREGIDKRGYSRQHVKMMHVPERDTSIINH